MICCTDMSYDIVLHTTAHRTWFTSVRDVTDVRCNNTPLENKTRETISLQSNGELFLLLGSRAKACLKGVLFQTPAGSVLIYVICNSSKSGAEIQYSLFMLT